jgi:hypothetical protein
MIHAQRSDCAQRDGLGQSALLKVKGHRTDARYSQAAAEVNLIANEGATPGICVGEGEGGVGVDVLGRREVLRSGRWTCGEGLWPRASSIRWL